MNFFEAYQEMKNGKYASILDDDKKFKVEGDKLYVYIMAKPGWEFAQFSINFLTTKQWRIYNELKEIKGLWAGIIDKDANNYVINISMCGGVAVHSLTVFHYGKESEAKAWRSALNTFMRLKIHPLAVKAKDCKNLYFIRCDFIEKKLFIDGYDHIDSQLSELSAPFECMENAEQAIKEIGKENLIHMFKTFQGIYE